jgi:nucleotide-binding universal stress UspA family protein
MTRIVVGVDLSPTSLQALRWSGRQASSSGAEIAIVHAWREPDRYGAPPALGTPKVAGPAPETGGRPLADAARDLVSAARSEAETELAGTRVHELVREGDPRQVLVAESEDADLLVLGRSGHGAFVGMLLGSVAQHVVAHSSCPAVVVPDSR